MNFLRTELKPLIDEAASEIGKLHKLVTFEATVIAGFEHQAVVEIKEKLKASHVFRVRGHVFFNASADDYETKVLKLRSIDNLYMVLHHFGSIKFNSNDKAADLAMIKSFALEVDWKSKLPIWASLVHYNGNLFPDKPSSPPVVPAPEAEASGDTCPPGAVVPEATIPSETTDVGEKSSPAVDAASTTPVSEAMTDSGVEELNVSLPGDVVVNNGVGSVDKSDDGGEGGDDKNLNIVIDNLSSETTDVSEKSPAAVEAAPTTPVSEATTSTTTDSGVEELSVSLPGAVLLTDDAGSVDKSDDGGGGGDDKNVNVVTDNASSDDFLSCSSGEEDEKEIDCNNESPEDVVTDSNVDIGQSEATVKTVDQNVKEHISDSVPLSEAISMTDVPELDKISVIEQEMGSVFITAPEVVEIDDSPSSTDLGTVDVNGSRFSTVPEEEIVPLVDNTRTAYVTSPEELEIEVAKREDLHSFVTEPIAQISAPAEPLSASIPEQNIVEEELPGVPAFEQKESSTVPFEPIPPKSSEVDELPAVPVAKNGKPIGRYGDRKGKRHHNDNRRNKNQKSTRVLKPYVDDGILKFRATCVRSGPGHSFSSMEAAWEFGGTLNDAFFWTVDLTRFDLNAVLNVEQDVVYVTAALTEESLHRRNITHFGPTTLRATTCYHLLHMAEPVKGEIIVDPMCGGGSIPIEGALAFPAAFYMGGDHHDKSMIRMEGNLKSFSTKDIHLRVDGLWWDTVRLPLKDSSVDVVVTDLPYGIRIGHRTNNRSFYKRVLEELSRVVRGGVGRAVLMTTDEPAFITALRSNQSWKLMRSTKVSHGGLKAVAFLLLRKKHQLP